MSKLTDWMRKIADGADLLLVGDGSGTKVGSPSASYVWAFETASNALSPIWSTHSSGTNNHAELYPYVPALWDYSSRVRKRQFGKVTKVKIVSDSEVTVKCGNGEYARSANQCLWASMDWFEANGFVFNWVHIPRCSHLLNESADAVAGCLRRNAIRIHSTICTNLDLQSEKEDGEHASTIKAFSAGVRSALDIQPRPRRNATAR